MLRRIQVAKVCESHCAAFAASHGDSGGIERAIRLSRAIVTAVSPSPSGLTRGIVPE